MQKGRKIMTDFPYILEIFLGIAFVAFAVSIGLLVSSAGTMIKSDKERTTPYPQDHVQTFLERKGQL